MDIEAARSLGIHGAHLLLLAGREQGLRRLMTHEDPLLRAGMSREEMIRLMQRSKQVDEDDNDDNDDGLDGDSGFGRVEGEKIVHDDGYGKARCALLLVNPQRDGGRRVGDSRVRGHEVDINAAITELDLE